MKCDELQYERLGDANKTYPASTLVIRKQYVDAAIAELKAKVDKLLFDKKLLENHWESEKIRCEAASRDCIELSNENAKLVSKIESLKVGHCQGIANLKSYYKAKLESVQATAYTESVDAGMENRRLKRALWLERANDASSFAGLFSTLSYIEDDESRTYWIFGNKRKIVIDGLKCSRMETAYKRFCIWDDVANKCLKKAEEYK